MKEKNGGILFSHREKRAIGWIVFFVILTRILLIFRPEIQIYSRPYTEDTFYLFSCAEHVAYGEGFSCDGIHPTNGVQPLIVILYVPLFLIAGANKLLALKLGFILIAIFDSLSVILIARLVRISQKNPQDKIFWKSPPVIASFLWAILYPILAQTANGLETGLYSMLLLGALYYYMRLSRFRSNGKKASLLTFLIFGIILGFTVLARIDAVFLVIMIVCFELYSFKTKGIFAGIIIAVTSFLVSSAWWWYNYSVFGSLMPQSGIAESTGAVIDRNINVGAFVFGDILSVFFVMPNYTFPLWFHAVWFIIVSVCVTAILWNFHLKKYLEKNYLLSPLQPYAVFCGLLIIIYVTSFNAAHMFPRFFQPFRILWLILVSCALPEIIRVLKQKFDAGGKIAHICAYLFVFSIVGYTGYKYSSLLFKPLTNSFYLAGKWALEHPDESIGMQQSGTAGFMAANVINLDGKVNFAALQAQRETDVGVYIEAEHIEYLIDLPDFVKPLVFYAGKHGGKFRKVDSIEGMSIFKKER
jgi:hypothetical protein